MDNIVTKWLTESFRKGTLNAALIDCQLLEYKKLRAFKNHFNTANGLIIGLRQHSIKVSHFMLDEDLKPDVLPFKYADKKGNIAHRELDFKIAVPTDEELVYPKTYNDGFTNPHAAKILETNETDGSVLICAGFIARSCLMETVIGSFKVASRPENHRVIIVSDATDISQYSTRFLKKIETEHYLKEVRSHLQDSSLRKNIQTATAQNILDTLQRLDPIQNINRILKIS